MGEEGSHRRWSEGRARQKRGVDHLGRVGNLYRGSEVRDEEIVVKVFSLRDSGEQMPKGLCFRRNLYFSLRAVKICLGI